MGGNNKVTPGLARAGVIRLGYKAKKCKCGAITGPLDDGVNCPKCKQQLGDNSFPRESPHFILKNAPGVAEVLGKTPTELRIYFPFDTTGEVFPHYMQLWSASSLLCRGDGDYILHAMERTTGKPTVRDGIALMDFTEGKRDFKAGQTMTCPGLDRDTYPKCADCKPNAMLIVMLRDIPRLAYYQITTSSFHNIVTLPEQLDYVRNMVHRLTGQSRITGIPFILRRVEKTVNVPNLNKDGSLKKDKDGKTLPPKQRVKKFFLELEIEPEWMMQLGQALARQSSPVAALPTVTPEIKQIQSGPITEPPTWEPRGFEVDDDIETFEGEPVEEEGEGEEEIPVKHPSRPWQPEYLKSYIQGRIVETANHAPPTPEQMVGLKGSLSSLAGEPERLANMVAYFTGKTVDRLTAGECEVLIRWIGCDAEYQPSPVSVEEVKAITALEEVHLF
jgi:hypothetical protein